MVKRYHETGKTCYEVHTNLLAELATQPVIVLKKEGAAGGQQRGPVADKTEKRGREKIRALGYSRIEVNKKGGNG